MKHDVMVKFNDETSHEQEVDAQSAIHAIEAVLRTPEVWKHAYSVIEVEVAPLGEYS